MRDACENGKLAKVQELLKAHPSLLTASLTKVSFFYKYISMVLWTHGDSIHISFSFSFSFSFSL